MTRDLMPVAGQEVRTEPLAKIDYMVGSADLYGDALSNLARLSLADPGFLSIFSYDWRQDNVRSAHDLHEWICRNYETFRGRQVVFIAHSMGGLILKYWMKMLRNRGCSLGDGNMLRPVDVREILFLGTPHYGSPMAIEVLARGYSFSGEDTDGLFGTLPRDLSAATTASALNDSGAAFHSTYQLLPINGEDCLPKDVEPFPLFTRFEGAPVPTGSIFNARTWETWKWPRHIPRKLSGVFYSDFLPDALSRARAFLCDVAAYDVSEDTSATYFFGQSSKADTPVAYEFEARDGGQVLLDRCSALSDECKVIGDGTVPSHVARDRMFSSAKNTRQTDFEHGKLLSSPQVSSYISNLLDDTSAFALTIFLNNEDVDVTFASDLAAENGLILPVMPINCIGCENNETIKLIKSINIKTGVKAKLDSNNLWGFAESTPSLAKKAEYAKAAYYMSPFDVLSDSKYLGLAGQSLYSSGSYDEAISTLSGAIYASEEASDEGALGKLYDIKGDAAVAAGDFEGARASWQTAVELGNDASSKKITELKYDSFGEQ